MLYLKFLSRCAWSTPLEIKKNEPKICIKKYKAQTIIINTKISIQCFCCFLVHSDCLRRNRSKCGGHDKMSRHQTLCPNNFGRDL